MVTAATLDSLPASFPAASFPGGAARAGAAAGRLLRPPARLYVGRMGKRLRPLITAVVLEGLGRRPGRFAGALGAIELMEASTVSFDDIIDHSDVRRGGPATHVLYGRGRAYLAYQAAYNWAYRAFLDPALPLEPRRRAELLSSLAREIFAYGYGQASELRWSARRRAPSPGEYLSMTWDRIRFLSFNGPLRIGALLGGAPREALPRFAAAGSWLGMAYHLHGDELNLFPRSAEWGKPLADDITGGRYTFLYLTAMRLSSAPRRRLLARALGDRRISGGALKNVIDIVRDSGAVAENRRKIGVFHRRAAAALKGLPLAAGSRRLLLDLARYMAYDRTK